MCDTNLCNQCRILIINWIRLSIGSHGDQQSIPTSPLAVIFKRADSADASIPKIVLETSANYSDPNSQTQCMTPVTPRRRKDPVKILIDADYSSHNLEPSIFSSPSLYSLHSEVSVHQETAKEEVLGDTCIVIYVMNNGLHMLLF